MKKGVIVIILSFIFLFSISCIHVYATDLNLKLTGTVSSLYSADFYLKTNPKANSGFDSHDMINPNSPDTFPVLF